MQAVSAKNVEWYNSTHVHVQATLCWTDVTSISYFGGLFYFILFIFVWVWFFALYFIEIILIRIDQEAGEQTVCPVGVIKEPVLFRVKDLQPYFILPLQRKDG